MQLNMFKYSLSIVAKHKLNGHNMWRHVLSGYERNENMWYGSFRKENIMM